jgi:hypothetical protein
MNITQFFYHFDSVVGYNRYDSAGEINKSKDMKNFFLYKV